MISYKLLTDALRYYADTTFANCGYKRIELPWSVPSEAINITAPDFAEWYRHEENYLVASGEQSFLELIKTGALTAGKYCGITPCFRGEDEDFWHQLYFMKVELINTANPTEASLESMLGAAEWFFKHVAHIQCKIVDTKPSEWDTINDGPSYDIVCDVTGVELGSYGIRKHADVGRWIYGTGLAEPRASKVLTLQRL